MRFSSADLEELQAKGFDAEGFEKVWADHLARRWDRELIVDASRIAPPAEDALVEIPARGSDDWVRFEEAGRDAIEAGQVGVLVLNGGMATRFGGVVKGTVEVVDGRSFLELKIAQIRKVGSRVPIYLMNSPATDASTRAHLDERVRVDDEIHHFVQPVAPRISMGGEVVRETDGSISTNGMGHGDTMAAFEAQCLTRFTEGGGKVVMVGNVDNLGATLDPVLVGMHLAAEGVVSVEVARRNPNDSGGMPVMLDGKLQLLEGLRWPEGMDDQRYRAFNTNTFYIDREVFEDPPVLDAYPVHKQVRGEKVVQFERILGEVTHFVQTSFIFVEQQGEESRFIPVKVKEDLVSQRDLIVSCLGKWEVV